MPATVTLQELSELTDTSVRSLRYYINRGWLPRPTPLKQGTVGRPAGLLPFATVDIVRLIKEHLQGSVDDLQAPTLGFYRYELDGQIIQSDIVEAIENDSWKLMRLRNGDTVLRKKAKGV